MRTLVRLTVFLLLLSVFLAEVWPQAAREQAAARMAHAYCSQSPAPATCESTHSVWADAATWVFEKFHGDFPPPPEGN